LNQFFLIRFFHTLWKGNQNQLSTFQLRTFLLVD
jgi:hypothetical protein